MDTHSSCIHWGIKPVLFQIGGVKVNSYPVFIALAIIAGGIVYYLEARKKKDLGQNNFLIVVGSVIGATIGAKLLEILINIDRLPTEGFVNILFAGKTIIGGLIGGTVGSLVTKKILKIKTKKGNLFAPAIAVGVSIGRIGCFLNGCCYGKPTSVSWSVDFGDGIYRHPTQLYESVFMLGMYLFMRFYFNNKPLESGYLFKFLMVNYFIFRFLVEFLREERIAAFGLTFFQIISIVVLLYLLFSDIKQNVQTIIYHGRTTRQ